MFSFTFTIRWNDLSTFICYEINIILVDLLLFICLLLTHKSPPGYLLT